MNLQQMALQHRVGPLVYWKLKGQLLDQWGAPEKWIEPLTDSYYTTFAYNTLLFRSLWLILATLYLEKIPVVLLKGASLATQVYENIGLRPMGDLDLLFERQDIPTAARVLQQQGLTPVVMEDEATPDNLNIYAQPFTGMNSPVAVEMHWDLFGRETHRYEPDLAWFIAQTEPFQPPQSEPVQMGDVRLPSDSLNFIYLSAHAVLKHRGSGEHLLWYVDLYRLASRGNLDWEWMAEAARRMHWGAGLVACLLVLSQDFGLPLPKGYLDQILASVEARDLEYVQQRGEMRNNWQGFLTTLHPLSWRDRGRFLWGAALPQPAYMRWRYRPSPEWAWPLMYPYRWVRGFLKLFFNAPDTPPPAAR